MVPAGARWGKKVRRHKRSREAGRGGTRKEKSGEVKVEELEAARVQASVRSRIRQLSHGCLLSEGHDKRQNNQHSELDWKLVRRRRKRRVKRSGGKGGRGLANQ